MSTQSAYDEFNTTQKLLELITRDRILDSLRMSASWLGEASNAAADDAGAFYAKMTLRQIARQCGDIREIIPDLIEIGVEILNPIQPECMDPAELKRKYGFCLSFWGTIGIQTTLPFGTPDDVRREVKQRIETVGRGGGLLIAPTHVIEPEVPWENIIAFVEAVKEYGIYR